MQIRTFAALSVLVLLTPFGWTQTRLDSIPGTAPSSSFGRSVAFIGDLDGDGSDEWIAGAYQFDGPNGANAGRARVFDGATGATLYVIDGAAPDAELGFSVDGAGDINGDSIPDFIIGSPGGPGRTLVKSGADGSTLYDVAGSGDRFGYVVSDAGDVDGDGRDDFAAIGANGFGSNAVRVYSGSTGALLFARPAHGGNGLIQSLDRAGDFNGDGFADVVIGHSLFFGVVAVLLGPTGALGYREVGVDSGSEFGFSTRGIGDVNGDGLDDLLVGSRGQGNLGPAAGQVDVLAGATGAVLATWTAPALDTRLGFAVSPAGDVDADGILDYAMLEPDAVDGLHVKVVSGATGASLGAFSPDPGESYALAGGGDVDGDGFSDLLISYPFINSGEGKVEIWTFGCPENAVFNYCTSAPNSAGPGAVMGHQNTPSLSANNLRLTASGCPTQTFGLFFYGPRAIEVPFGEGFRCVGGHTYRLQVVGTGQGGTPSFQLNTAQPPQPSGEITAGSTWFFQFWHRDNVAGMQTHNLSDGLRITFCP